MSNITINYLPTASTIDGSLDILPIYTASSAATQGINRNTLLGISSAPVGLTDSQSMTNKTLGITNTVTLLDTLFTLEDNGDNTKKLQFQLSGITTGNTRTLTVPDISDTLVTLTASQTLTNKTLTSPTINAPTITNATITADAITGFTTANSGTLYSGITVTTGNVSMSGTLGVTGATTLSSTLGVTGLTTLTGQLSVQTGTAPPASGATTSGIKVSSTSNFGIFWGSGAPTFSAAQGAIYLRTDGSSSSTRMYVNSTGSTTWVNFTSAS